MGSGSSTNNTNVEGNERNSNLISNATQLYGADGVGSSNSLLPGAATTSELPPQLDNHGVNESVVVTNPLHSISQENGTNYKVEPIVENISDDLSGQSVDVESGNNYNSTSITGTNIPIDGTNNSYSDLTFFGITVYLPKWPTLSTLASWIAPMSSVAMVVCCVLPYVPQYATIYKSRNSSGFSTFVCLTLLLANILRVAFWFGVRFEIPLLIQSIVMILTQILLLELCIRVTNACKPTLSKRSFFNPKHFWRWNNLTSYIEFLCLFSALLGIAMYFLIDFKPFVETIGYCSLLIEAMLGLPQAIRNFRCKSVAGMSLIMVLLWLGGDLFKTVYYITRSAPYQFWLCGIIQITVDLLILFQVCLYRQNAPIKMGPQEMMAL